MTALARFTVILANLRAVVAAHAARDRAQSAAFRVPTPKGALAWIPSRRRFSAT